MFFSFFFKYIYLFKIEGKKNNLKFNEKIVLLFGMVDDLSANVIGKIDSAGISALHTHNLTNNNLIDTYL